FTASEIDNGWVEPHKQWKYEILNHWSYSADPPMRCPRSGSKISRNPGGTSRSACDARFRAAFRRRSVGHKNRVARFWKNPLRNQYRKTFQSRFQFQALYRGSGSGSARSRLPHQNVVVFANQTKSAGPSQR